MSSYPDPGPSGRTRSVARTADVLATIIAVAIAVFPPVIYFFFAYQMERVQLHADTVSGAERVTEFINKKQYLWRYDEIRLRGVIAHHRNDVTPDIRRIRDTEGNIVIQHGRTPVFPVITSSEEVLDAGRVVGRYEVVRSIRSILANTGWVAAIGILLGACALLVFRIFPLKTLRRTVDTLAEERDRANVTLESIGDGVIVTDPEGGIVSLNRVGEQVTEWTRQDALGRPLSEVFRREKSDGAETEEPPQWDTGGKESFSRERIVSRNGTERIVDGIIGPIRDRHEHPRGHVLVFRDITEKVREEEELFKARKLESIGLLAGGIAHDFNNILVGIMGNLSLAKLSAFPETKILDRIEEAEKASGKAKELVSRLLAFSKGGKPVRERMQVQDLLRDSALLAARGSSSEVTFRIRDDLWMAEIDPVQLDQVISNLVVNAVQAMPGGGTVRIEAENAVVEEGEIRHVRGGDYLRILVKDEGAGIPKEIRDKIFDPHFTTKRQGSGLGLTTCYTIMKSHKGNIFLESEPGAGAVFLLYLPAVPQSAPPKEPLPAERASSGMRRILVMDDEEMVLDVAGRMLAHLGYEPVLARDGEEAVERLAEMTSVGIPVGLVILDLNVPGGMGGIETGRRILDIDPDAKILVSSGHASRSEMEQYREHGFAGFLGKPYKIGELSREIGNILRSVPA